MWSCTLQWSAVRLQYFLSGSAFQSRSMECTLQSTKWTITKSDCSERLQLEKIIIWKHSLLYFPAVNPAIIKDKELLKWGLLFQSVQDNAFSSDLKAISMTVRKRQWILLKWENSNHIQSKCHLASGFLFPHTLKDGFSLRYYGWIDRKIIWNLISVYGDNCKKCVCQKLERKRNAGKRNTVEEWDFEVDWIDRDGKINCTD